ncbi:MAG: right-handed parallel beta-helix repeat-containing protein [Kiritimatiellae bacterium]|nr:right-handed parallel beta-helix repeat-containing protein [Kiritimatiellia bacterium]MDD5520529.1 right-handed parallel beta-helix repeat-containing protein [Kiritimatiellia bacterium]
MKTIRVNVPFMMMLFCVVSCFVSVPIVSGIDLYVAVDGNDSWSGQFVKPNSGKTDGPLASLNGTRDAIRKLRSTGKLTEPVKVNVRGGIYRMNSPFVLESQDSGSEETPIIFQAYKKEKPVFSGGRCITGFRKNGSLWETDIPEVKTGKWYFRQLFVDGQRRQRARGPNEGYFRIESLMPGPKDAQGKEIARDKFVFKAGDLASWARITDVNLVLMHSWETSIHPLKSINTVSNVVEFAALMKEWWCIGYWEKNQRYYVENALELLDQPGEWYLNRETGVLSYWPMPGERLNKAEVIAPVLTELVRITGNADEGRFVQHVTFRGLTFHHADWVLNPKGNSSTQAAVEVLAVVTADGALHCSFEKCEVAHIGTYGVWFKRGCKDCRIQQNRIFDFGAGGVRIGEDKMAQTDVAESSRNLIDNNHIFDGGHVYAGAIGIWVAQSSYNRISHNDIHDMYYSGMSIGWNWGLEPNRTHHNVIEFNHVHNLGHGALSDCGLIYTLGISPGSVIRNNVFHDMWPYTKPSLGWGIYLDGKTGSYLIESNLVYNTLSGGLMFNNGGHAHIIRNNIFALSANEALWPYSEKRPSTFRDNIVYLTQGILLTPHGEHSLNERIAAKEPPGDWDNNVYWHTGGADQIRFYRRSFAEWKALGLDQHSVVADPEFVSPVKHDFRLKKSSPALNLGFQPIDISRVGLYGDSDWANEVRHRKCPKIALPLPPQPPKPVEINDDFEKTAAGMVPANTQVSGEEKGASIRVSEERASGGKRSLKVTDSKNTQPSWQPHFYYEPHLVTGVVCQSFDAWICTNAQFATEWRDSGAYSKSIGPSVLFNGNGNITVAGKVLTTIPPGNWLHVEIEMALGKNVPRSFKITLTPAGGVPQTYTDLVISGQDFHELHWLGFCSIASADTVFYLDNVVIKRLR